MGMDLEQALTTKSTQHQYTSHIFILSTVKVHATTCTHMSFFVSQSAAPDPGISPCRAICHTLNLLPALKDMP